MSKVLARLSTELMQYLQGQNVILLNVVEKNSGDIYSTALSWVYSVNPDVIRFAIDAKSEFVRILQSDSRLLLNFIAHESVYSVKGRAEVKVERTDDLTLKLALLEVQVEEIRDIIFYGGKVVSQPAFAKTYNLDLVRKLDDEVKQALIGLS